MTALMSEWERKLLYQFLINFEQEPILEEIRREIRTKNLSSLLDHNRFAFYSNQISVSGEKNLIQVSICLFS